MKSMKRALGGVLALMAFGILFGCSSAPKDEEKGVKAGDGSQVPTAAGATGGAPAGGVGTKAGSTKAN